MLVWIKINGTNVFVYIDTIWHEVWNIETRDEPTNCSYTRKRVYSMEPKQSTVNKNPPWPGAEWVTMDNSFKGKTCAFAMPVTSLTMSNVTCSDFLHTRNKFYITNGIFKLFRDENTSEIKEYIKELGLYDTT